MIKKNNKNRLYELMHKVGGINKELLCEENLPIDKKQLIVNDFISFVSEKIKIDREPNVSVLFEENEMAITQKSFGSYNPEMFEITIVGYNRNLADILRTLAHELIHHKQNLNNELFEKSGKTGSKHENKANAMAGVLMREYGKKNPIIFE